MYNKFIVLIFLLLALAVGCASKKTPEMQEPDSTVDLTSAQLAEAANSVSQSLYHLAELEKTATKSDSVQKLSEPASYAMPQLVSLDWNGPIEKLLALIAKENHYRLRTLGTPPSIPILVDIHKRNVPLAEIMREIDYQSGLRAHIHVYPRQRIIEIRYAPV